MDVHLPLQGRRFSLAACLGGIIGVTKNGRSAWPVAPAPSDGGSRLRCLASKPFFRILATPVSVRSGGANLSPTLARELAFPLDRLLTLPPHLPPRPPSTRCLIWVCSVCVFCVSEHIKFLFISAYAAHLSSQKRNYIGSRLSDIFKSQSPTSI